MGMTASAATGALPATRRLRRSAKWLELRAQQYLRVAW